MQNNTLITILFITFFAGICTCLYPQESTDRVRVDSVVWQSNGISNDSLLQIVPQDTARVAEKSFDAGFREKYTGRDFDYENGGGGRSLMQKLRDWFNNLLRHLLGTNRLHDFNKAGNIFMTILYAIIFLTVVYVITRLVMNHRGRWFFEKRNQTVSVNLENVEEHIHEADFESMIRQTEQQGNTRQSIRLYYLWVLKTFSDKGLIEWHAQKTNADYVREIAGDERKNEFRYLSYLYNYIWYGEFSINDEEFVRARHTFLKQIKQNGK